MGADQIPEQVFADAEKAANDATGWHSALGPVETLAFRAAVASAYRAGQAAAPDGHLVAAVRQWRRMLAATPDDRAGTGDVSAAPEGPRTWSLALADISYERERQIAKWGEQNHPDGTGLPGDDSMAKADRAKCKANGPDEDNWRDILQEEVSEAFAETDPRALRGELVQVAAVAVAWMEAIDRRPLTDATPTDGQDGDGHG